MAYPHNGREHFLMADIHVERKNQIEVALAVGDKQFWYPTDKTGAEEKSQPGKNFSNINKLVAFVDPVDGTDLAARGFSNWVSAIIFLIPKQRRILSAVVGHSSGDIYYASDEGAFVRPGDAGELKNHDKKLKRKASKRIDLCNASVCYYGQKPKNFLELAKKQGFLAVMENLRERMSEKKDPESGKVIKKKEGLDVRIYNFGGNPMMVKIPSGTVDAVFSLGGAKIYDVMPGAYIAIKAGAVFTDLNGQLIDPITPFLTPNKPIRYILSGSEALSKELVQVLGNTTQL